MYLNLSRKWRSKKFEEVIGQDFAIKVLKNCLYRDLISPVYLISGPKGCGKTTVARLFAAALNCEHLSKFRSDPKNISLPCSSCQSCTLFNKSAHPDFIEIDAASNTGVENVRQIIDSASFVPAIGSKRIYLIDEAHMLSKAAFNALLKTLEEPPASVLFILATTEVNKIIETVRSRCFQMFFTPIDKVSLHNYLVQICKAEEIECNNEALNLLVEESYGSARDALNLLEKVRAGFITITKDAVFAALGLIPEEHLMTLIELIINQHPQDMMAFYLDHNLEKFDQFILFKKLVNLIYLSLTLKMNLKSNIDGSPIEKLKSLISNCSIDLFIKMLDLCYSVELILLKTTNPAILMQNLLIKLCLLNSRASASSETLKEGTRKKIGQAEKNSSQTIQKATVQSISRNDLADSKLAAHTNKTSKEWYAFLQALEQANDPLIFSIFKQGHFELLDNVIHLTFSKDLAFFRDCLENAKATWRPLLTEAFKEALEVAEVGIRFVFAEEVQHIAPLNNPVLMATRKPDSLDNQGHFNKKVEITVKPEYVPNNKVFKKAITKTAAQNINIQVDLDKFQKVNAISKLFPGKVISSLAIDNTLERKNE